jgi:hypothetical protein
MIRVVKIGLIVAAIPVAVIVAGIIWIATLFAADKYKWGWLEVPVRYRLTFGVEVGGVAYTSSTVAQVTYQEMPAWQVINGPGIASLYQGQAGILKLGDGRMICLLLNADYLVPGEHYGVPGLANRLLSINGSPTGPKQKWSIITALNAPTVTGSSDIPIGLLPPMIVLDDPADPSSAHLFDPEHPELSLGLGTRFLGAQIAATNDPVSHDIEKVFPWLNDPSLPQMLSKPGDPILRENQGRPLYKAFFY